MGERFFGLAPGFPEVSPDQLGLDGFEECEEDQDGPQWGVSLTQDHRFIITMS